MCPWGEPWPSLPPVTTTTAPSTNVKGWCRNRSLLPVREKVCRMRFGMWKERKRTAELYSSCASCFYSVRWRDSETAIKWGQVLEITYLMMMQRRGKSLRTVHCEEDTESGAGGDSVLTGQPSDPVTGSNNTSRQRRLGNTVGSQVLLS